MSIGLNGDDILNIRMNVSENECVLCCDRSNVSEMSHGTRLSARVSKEKSLRCPDLVLGNLVFLRKIVAVQKCGFRSACFVVLLERSIGTR